MIEHGLCPTAVKVTRLSKSIEPEDNAIFVTGRKHPRLEVITRCDVDYCMSYIRKIGLDIAVMLNDE